MFSVSFQVIPRKTRTKHTWKEALTTSHLKDK